MTEKLLTVRNRAGIHARPAALIAQTANRFSCEVTMVKDDAEVNAKSIMGVITMAAAYNSTITLRTDGPDEVQCADAIVQLFESRFEEE
jgi:phosphocarrier protein